MYCFGVLLQRAALVYLGAQCDEGQGILAGARLRLLRRRLRLLRCRLRLLQHPRGRRRKLPRVLQRRRLRGRSALVPCFSVLLEVRCFGVLL